MATKRTKLNRPVRRQISPAAVAAFRAMEVERANCTCRPIDWSSTDWMKRKPCAACDRWSEHHQVLHTELDARPWEFPVFYYPEAVNPYPPRSHKAAAVSA